MENAKVSIGKNKKIKIALSYVGLVFLVILIALPPIFRATFEEEKKSTESVVTTLECIKDGETVRSTFLNQKPQVLIYKISGNYLEKTSADRYDIDILKPEEYEYDNVVGDEETTTKETDNSNPTTQTEIIEEPNEVLEKIRPIGTSIYDDATNITEFRIAMENIEGSDDYKLIFSSVENQETYFKNHNFTCNKTTESF